MTTIEYLSMSGPERAFFKTIDWFKSLPGRISRGCSKLPTKLRRFGRAIASPLVDAYDAARYGDWRTRLSFLIMGFGHVTRHQVIRGIFYFAYEVIFIVFMCLVGAPNLAAFSSLGQMANTFIIVNGMTVQFTYDNSLSIMLYSVISIVLICILAYLYFGQLKDSMKLQRSAYIGHYSSDSETLKNVLDRSYHRTLLTIPLTGIVVFTIIPLIVMILIGFTNYNTYHLSPAYLFDWVGLSNFATLFSVGTSDGNQLFLYAFGMVLLWTLIWAFFATFSNYFLGMIVAMIINAKGVKLKKVWRTILITTIAVPQFISLLLMSRMLASNGIFNEWLKDLGWIQSSLPFLTDSVLAKVMIIVVNTWIGIPYTMLICTGLLMNIPADLYESAKIDGAGPFKTYFKITLPYMLFVTTPYLISQFVGNINNFNVIYLLTSGNPAFVFQASSVPTQLAGVGQTDLLITWIYKLCMTNTFKDYGTASILGLMVFVVVAFFSLVVFNNSKSVKNEEDYQ